MALIPFPQDSSSSPGVLVRALVAIRDSDSEEPAEALRREHCAVCRATAGESPEERLRICRERRCGLLDPAALRAESAWALSAFRDLLNLRKAPPQKVAAFNEHIARAGCATAGIRRYDDGSSGRQFYAPTLRGALHNELVTRLTVFAGSVVELNVSDLSVEHAGELVAEMRTAWLEAQESYVGTLARMGWSKNKIAQATGIPRSTVIRWLANGEQGVSKSGGNGHVQRPLK
jgi:hypothetical protein